MNPLELLALSIGCYLIASLVALSGCGKQELLVVRFSSVLSILGEV
ncbi:hypothetical protein P4S72_05410 [Vibrio sp. PP-XX7]